MKQLNIFQFKNMPLKKRVLLAAAAILFLNVLLYFNTLHFDFLKDDFRLIVENPRITNFKTFIHSFNTQFFAFPDYPYLHYWRPFSLFSFYIDYQAWNLNPAGFHLTNVILNALNGLLIFFIFYTLFKEVLPAFFVSFLFSLHPTHVEAVSWVSGRTDLLAAFFIFLATLCFIRFLDRKKWLLYFLTAVFFVFGLLSKENAVLFPMLAVGSIFLNPFPGEIKKTVKEKFRLALFTIPFWVLDVVYIILHNRYSGVQEVVADFSFSDIFLIFKTVGAYTRIILMPFFPTFHFSMHNFDSNYLEYAGYAVLAVIIFLFILANREKYRRSIYFSLFFIFLVPVLDPNIVPSYPKIVTRFAYIPAVFAGVFLWDTFSLLDNKRLKTIYIGLVIIISCVWISETLRFQGYFKDQYAHYEGLIPHDPGDSSLLLPMALISAQDGNYSRALELVDSVLEVNPQDRWLDVGDMAGLLKANLLVITGRGEEGKSMAEGILKETKEDEMKYYGCLVLSKYHEKRGEYTLALDMLKRAAQIGETADLYYRKSLVYAKMGVYPDALSELKRAKQLNPTMKKYNEFERFLRDKYKNPSKFR